MEATPCVVIEVAILSETTANCFSAVHPQWIVICFFVHAHLADETIMHPVTRVICSGGHKLSTSGNQAHLFIPPAPQLFNLLAIRFERSTGPEFFFASMRVT